MGQSNSISNGTSNSISNSISNGTSNTDSIIELLKNLNEQKKFNLEYTLKQDRLISLDPSIVIGINGKKQAQNKNNPFSAQCLRLNDQNELHSLQMYEQTNKTLCYEFENNIRLCFIKHNDGILLNLKTPQKCNTQQMDDVLINNFKSLHFASPEFDLIENFFKNKPV